MSSSDSESQRKHSDASGAKASAAENGNMDPAGQSGNAPMGNEESGKASQTTGSDLNNESESWQGELARQQAAANSAAADFETEFYRKNPILWWTSFFGPGLIAILILSGIFLTGGMEALQNLAFAILATFVALGRFVILFGGDEIQFGNFVFELSKESLFIMVTTMDFLVAFFVAFHMGILFHLPVFGPKLEGMVSDGRFILKHQPWIRNIAFTGLVLFVIFPSSTTGSIGGSIFGRLLGMKRTRVVVAILIGSVLGNGLMYLLAGWISQYISKDNIWLKLGGVIMMIIVLFFAERYYRKMKAKYMSEENVTMPGDDQ